MIRRLLTTLAVVAAAAGVLVPPPVADVASAAPAEEKLWLFTDSVGLGAKHKLPGAFPPGWEVRTFGEPALFTHKAWDKRISPQLHLDPSLNPDHVVIAVGYNFEFWDPTIFDRAVDQIVTGLAARGVEHVYWVTLREVKPQYISPGAWRQIQPYYWYFPTVNERLELAVERHPNLTLVDWRANADEVGLTYDAIHLNNTGARRYSNLIAEQVRNARSRLDNGSVTRVHVTDDPATSAVAVNLTATGTRATGWFGAYSCDGERPNVSNLNHRRWHTVAAAAIVPVGPSGDICVFNQTSSQVIVDLFGRFGATADIVDSTPTRLHDSRSAGPREPALQELRLKVAEPGTAAVALNVTALNVADPGFVTVQACGLGTLDTSNVNVVPGAITPNLVMAEPDADGFVCVVPSVAAHLIVDRFASFGPAAPIDLVAPERVRDTRGGDDPRAPGRVVRFSVDDTTLDTGAPISGVFMNITIVAADGPGFGTAYPCAVGRPDTSNVNYETGQTIANFAVVEPDADGEICVFTSAAADVLVDVMGSSGPGFDGLRPMRLFDSRSG